MHYSFLQYYKGVIFHPGRTFGILTADEKMLSKSFRAVSITAVLYTFVYIFLIFGGGEPFKPWLDIPQETYYRYNVFFCAPSMYLGWILSAGVVHLLSRLLTSAGNFEQILCVFGFGIGIASWTTGIHDFLTSLLGAIQVIDQGQFEHALNAPTVWRTILWILMLAYLLWFIILFSKGVKSVYAVESWKSLILAIIGFAVYQLFFLIFNR